MSTTAPPTTNCPSRVAASTLGVGIALFLAACSGGGSGRGAGSGVSSTTAATTSSTVQNVPVNPKTADFGQTFRLGRVTIVVTDAGPVPGSNPGGSPRRRLIVETTNTSSAADRTPGLAIVCEQRPARAGGSIYADPHPVPRPYIAGKVERAGQKDAASTTVGLDPTCRRPALQVSTGGATINGLPGPVLIAMA